MVDDDDGGYIYFELLNSFVGSTLSFDFEATTSKEALIKTDFHSVQSIAR